LSNLRDNIHTNNQNELSKQPDPVDIHVGKRIKLRRTMLKISQDQLANEIGVTFQQVQKYESGHNRVSASRLFNIANFMTCPISYFFEDFEHGQRIHLNKPLNSGDINYKQTLTPNSNDPMLKTETLEVVRAYWKISNTELRMSIKELLTNLSKKE
jgi:transcriptional regulator with XRE-family HTH domain